MENLEWFDKKFKDSLKLLALPYDKQKKCFPDFVDTPFEVVDTFNNMFLQLPKLIETDMYTNQQIANIIRLYNLVKFTLNDPDFFTKIEDEFRVSSQWKAMGDLSIEILDSLGESIEEPNLDYYYFKGGE